MFSKCISKCAVFILLVALMGGVGRCYVVEPPIVQVEMDKAGMHRFLRLKTTLEMYKFKRMCILIGLLHTGCGSTIPWWARTASTCCYSRCPRPFT